jgi:hypothetical protein
MAQFLESSWKKDPRTQVAQKKGIDTRGARDRERSKMGQGHDRTGLSRCEVSVGCGPAAGAQHLGEGGRVSDRVDPVLAVIDYIHRNPERRGLVECAIDWQWSSGHWFETDCPTNRTFDFPKLERLPAEFLAHETR